MYKIRAFEEQANELYLPAIMPGLTHLYAGEEVVAVGVCEPLAPHNSMFDVPDEDLDIIYDKLD
jgi:pyruvate dehydrogenase E1 component alpha subunit